MRQLYSRLKKPIQHFKSRIVKLKPENTFLSIGLVAGLAFLIMIPPLAAYDETEHFFRSYQLSDFNLFSDKTEAPNVIGAYKGSGFGGSLPVSVVDVSYQLRWGIQTEPTTDKSFKSERLAESLAVPLERNVRKEVRFDNTAINSPAAYMPQSVGIQIGKLFDLGPVFLIYLGRLANLLFWLSLIFFAIKLTPVGKWAFVAVALNPAFVFLSGTLSPDTVAGALAALVVALVLYFNVKTNPVSKYATLLFVGLVVLVCMTKNIYLPLVLSIFMVPPRILKARWKILATVTVLVLTLSWNSIILPMTKGIPDYFHRQDNVSASEQIEFITSKPNEFAEIITWNVFGSPSVIASYNYVYAIADNVVPFWVILLWLVCTVISFLLHTKSGLVLKRWIRVLFLIMISTSALLAALSLYIGWAPVGNKFMEGIQGRYLFPVTFLLIPLLISSSFYIAGNIGRVKKIVILGFIVALGATITIVGLRYWNGIIV